QIAATGRIYLTAQTATLVKAFFDLEPIGRIRVKGVRQPVRTFALLRAGAVRTRIHAAQARGFSRFIGRDDEIAVLEAALGRAMAGHGQVMAVIGAPGVGKSRLTQEAVERWRAQRTAVAEAHCPAHGRSLPFAALHDLLLSLFDVARGERSATVRAAIR